MNRRQLLKTALTATLAACFPPTITWAMSARRPSLTLSQLLHAAFPGVLQTMREGEPWATYRMRELEREQRVLLLEVGMCVRTLDGVDHPVHELSCPLLWTVNDEQRVVTRHDKINFIARMLQNGINSQEDMLVEQIGTGLGIVSTNYQLWMGATRLIAPTCYCTRLYTAYAILPERYRALSS